MILSKDRIGGCLLLIFCISYGILSQEIKLLPFQENVAFHARTAPELLSVLGISLSLLLILFPGSSEKPSFTGLNWLTFVSFIALMSVYGMTIRSLGFLLSTSGFLIVGFLILGERKTKTLLLSSIPLVIIFWVLMTQGLEVFIEPLPAFLKTGR